MIKKTILFTNLLHNPIFNITLLLLFLNQNVMADLPLGVSVVDKSATGWKYFENCKVEGHTRTFLQWMKGEKVEVLYDLVMQK